MSASINPTKFHGNARKHPRIEEGNTQPKQCNKRLKLNKKIHDAVFSSPSMEKCPPEVLCNVFDHLSDESLSSLVHVSRYISGAVIDYAKWKHKLDHILFRHFGINTAEEAVDFCIKNGSPYIDLREFGDAITDDLVVKLIERLPHIHSLLIKSSTISNVSLSHIAKLTQLTKLNLEWCKKITNKGLEHLTKLTQLTKLNLKGCNKIRDNGFKHLTKLTQLTNLNLSCCFDITDNGLEYIAKLTQLKELNLCNCHKITDNGLEHLTKLKQLTNLNLSWCDKITDNGLEYIAKLTQLKELNLSYCYKITDNGLEYIAKLTQLKELNLYECCKITDNGLEYIAKLTQLTYIKWSRVLIYYRYI